jgi:hypothetical protein
MSDEMTVRALRGRLEHGETTAAQAVATLASYYAAFEDLIGLA